ncbi:YrhB domain-containing protein [Streptomyces sp. NPDC086766]|uniref:YrhB domain-containing protein n=1 Tax=Streptomyces sp. NPDC086766 TaxID=3365754 RepID=UPI0038026059
MVVIGVERHSLGWLVRCQSQRFARTRNWRDAFVGHGPFLVDELDGSLHMVHRQFCSDGLEWEDHYRRKVRGEIPRRELDVEVERLLGLGRRFDALKAARRAGGGFNPADAVRFVDAISSGVQPPSDLVARLPQPDTRYLAIRTYSGPNPEPADWSPVRGSASGPGRNR